MLDLHAVVCHVERGLAADKEVDVQHVVALGIDIAGERGHKAGDVARAARAVEPRAARRRALVELVCAIGL